MTLDGSIRYANDHERQETRGNEAGESMTDERLSSYNFSDLYISIGNDTMPIIKGLRHRSEGFRPKRSGVHSIPVALVRDTATLSRKISDYSEANEGLREFTIAHDDVMYRCSLIAPPEGRFSIVDPEKPDFAVQNWCVRHLSDRVPSLSNLGCPGDITRNVMSLRKDRGLMLISGSFASGKTTTASAVIDTWVEAECEVGITLEDPPEMPLARITEDRGAIYQVDLTEKPFHVAIKHARRWSPRYVFLGEIRTPETAAELLHMAISGPLVICTIHSSDPVQAIMSLCRFASQAMDEQTAREMVASSTRMILHQDMANGHVKMQMAQLSGRENYGIRNKIALGQFQKMYEDIERQRINRQKQSLQAQV